MKVTDKNSIRDIRGNRQHKAGKSNAGGMFNLFASELSNRQEELRHYNKDIHELKSALDEIGSRVEQEPTIKNFKLFRDILGKLASQVSNEAYRLEKVGGTPMNPRYFEIITVINKEADKLYELIVKEQKDRMAITASVIGIKGLVVDLIT